MRAIVEVHHPGIKDALPTTALTRFYALRETPGLKKEPSTSDVLGCLKPLLAEDLAPADLRRSGRDATAVGRAAQRPSGTCRSSSGWRSWPGASGSGGMMPTQAPLHGPIRSRRARPKRDLEGAAMAAADIRRLEEADCDVRRPMRTGRRTVGGNTGARRVERPTPVLRHERA